MNADAVIVVSEQTGDVSIAERGVLMKKLTPDALRGMLNELLHGAEGKAFGFPVMQEQPSAADMPAQKVEKVESELVEK